MDTPHHDVPLPQEVILALDAIYAGSSADSLESDILEFKEDPSRRELSGKRGGNPRAELIEKLIDESVCIANGDAAQGHIIVGISDKKTGPSAFIGTEFDDHEIAHRIFNGTRPNLRVEVSSFFYHGARLLSIRIPEALTLYTRTKGQASRRVGSSCEVLDELQRQSILSSRAVQDYSNGSTSFQPSDIALDVLNEARRQWRHKHQVSGDSAITLTNEGFLRELGLLTEGGYLKKAAEILMLPPAQSDVRIRYLWRELPGSEPQVTELSEPVITALPTLQRLISSHSAGELTRVQFDDGQEISIPHFPSNAIDEVITNAIIHRQWELSNPVVVDQSPTVLKVWSPGPLPSGVTENNLLSTQSKPRNNRLMAALRILGLAEESSRGFDRMWAAMISSGRDIPEVISGEDFFEVIISAGQPDKSFIVALRTVGDTFGQSLVTNVNVLIALWHLWNSPILTLKTAKEKMQTSATEVRELMSLLCSFGLIEQIRDASEWVVSGKLRDIFGQAAPQGLAGVSIEDWIRTKLEEGESLSSAEIAEELGVPRKDITEMLRLMRSAGRAKIDPNGPSRGSNTRWIAG